MKKSWTEISHRALLANYRTLVRAASPPSGPDTPVLAVIKANAYGHSIALCAPILASAGAPWLGVTDPTEALCARDALSSSGLPLESHPHILLMSGPLPSDAETILTQRFTPTLWAPDHLTWFTQAARSLPPAPPIPFHLELDTGMSRQGARPGPELAAFLDLLALTPCLTLDGIFTHLSSSEISLSPETVSQKLLFEAALNQIRQHPVFTRRPAGSPRLWLHASNSSALDSRHPAPARTTTWLNHLASSLNARPLARAGLALYGYTLPLDPSASPQPQPQQDSAQPSLHPVLSWKTRILAIRDIPAGTSIGYNATFTTSRPTRVALLPVGYADGLRRELSSTSTRPGGWAILDQQRTSILGRISMNLTTIDVTEIPSAQPNDEVTLLGPGITAYDHALLARTIPYEILCALRATPRLTH